MAVTIVAGILTCTLAEISSKEVSVNRVWNGSDGNTAPATGRVGRLSVYEPLVVRVSDHPYDKYGVGTGKKQDPEHMALFESKCHGAPWVMVGNQSTFLRHDGKAPIDAEDKSPYSIIVVDFDYKAFA